ncbi:MAG: sensor histidine kinase [Solobacterium sp.]|nr:sensor histidine kinase [Solobacterium sp.]
MSRTGSEKTRQRMPLSINMIILSSFTAITAAAILLIGMTLYRQFADRARRMMMESTEQLTERASVTLEDKLFSMRKLSDAMYYSVIKDQDFADGNVDEAMNLFYEANKDTLISFALFTPGGNLVSAAPSAIVKPDLDVTRETWFVNAQNQVENLHFSLPHVQNLFDDPNYRYYWVISLSRVTELTFNGVPRSGVLLVDMKYSTITQMLDEINATNSTGQYMYLTDSDGTIIYHPKQMQISSGLTQENNLAVPDYEDGITEETFNGESRVVITDTIAYTGWRLISVIPASSFSLTLSQMRYFVFFVITIMVLAVILINRLVAERISRPVTSLDEAIRETGEHEAISDEAFRNGSLEVTHLGQTLQEYQIRNNQLMNDVVREQEEKRRSELDALQSQINPHFLYNTLDSIVWMIESGNSKEAIQMITQLANIFRISLSKGHTIIPLEDELRHAENYMRIQNVRFKNAFTARFDTDPALNRYSTVKLIIQPILENAIYYGVKNMDEDGMIIVRDWVDEGVLYISVEDNGFGMPKEVVDHLLDEDRSHVRSKGSGVGLYNVHQRIRLRYGPQYGLTIESEPDTGTVVIIKLPAIPYSEEMREVLERPEGRGSAE